MVVYQVTQKDCYGDCSISSNGAMTIDVTDWYDNGILNIGPYKIQYPYSYRIYEVRYYYDYGGFRVDPFMTTNIFTYQSSNIFTRPIPKIVKEKVEITIRVGERKAIAIPRRKGDIYIYLENAFVMVNRKELDYHKYISFYNFMKAVRLKKVPVEELQFRFKKDRMEVYNRNGNEYYYEYTEDYITFLGGFNVPVFTKNGLEHVNIDGEIKINVGECLQTSSSGEILCFGDPK